MLDYLPLLIILAGLGIMAYYLNRDKKSGHLKRRAMAEKNGWGYEARESAVVAGLSNEERSILYRLTGKTEEGISWELKARAHLNIQKSMHTKVETSPDSAWKSEIRVNNDFLLLPVKGDLPESILKQALNNLDFSADMYRFKKDELPASLAGNYELFVKEREFGIGLLKAVTSNLTSWQSTYPGKDNDITAVANKEGIRLKVLRTLQKEKDIEDMISLGVAIARYCK